MTLSSLPAMKVSPRPIAIVPFDADHTVSNMVAVVASSELLLSKISANMNSKLELKIQSSEIP